ncbi:hypothetical protein DV737_g3170, partial [Chaetothyriales sp. CBS 132003]
MASAKPETQHDEGAAWKPSTGQKIKNFIRKTWWIGLIVAIVLVAVLVPVLLLVIYPHIAQHEVNKASLVVLEQKALSPTANSIALDINNTFLIKSSYHPILYPFNASLYLDEDASTPFVSFETPKINHVKNGTIVYIQDTVTLYNLDQFAAFTEKALTSSDFNVILRGKGKLKEGGLTKTTVTYKTKAALKGLDGLSSINVASVTLLKTALSDGTNAEGVIDLYNPSVFTLELGNVSLSLTGPSPNNTALGTTTLLNTVLSPGNNTLNADITADIFAIASLITQDSRYGCAVFPVNITGNNVTMDGVDIPYYTSAMKQINLSTTLNLTSTLEDAGYGALIGTCES